MFSKIFFFTLEIKNTKKDGCEKFRNSFFHEKNVSGATEVKFCFNSIKSRSRLAKVSAAAVDVAATWDNFGEKNPDAENWMKRFVLRQLSDQVKCNFHCFLLFLICCEALTWLQWPIDTFKWAIGYLGHP